MIKDLLKPFIDRMVYASAGYEELKNAIISRSATLIDFNTNSESELDVRIRRIANLVKPHHNPSGSEVRIGGPNDGGYVMQKIDPNQIDGVLSIGVGPDVSWDQDVSKMGMVVHMFDPTIKRIPAPVKNGIFHRIGIGAVDSTDSKFVPIAKLREIAGLSQANNILLKIDVEGAEWTSLSQLPAGELDRYSQIAIEMHNLGRISNSDYFEKVIEVLEALHHSHVSVHLHANNYAPLANFGTYWFPDAIEVTYIRRDSSQDYKQKASVHSDLDRPNCPTMVDFNLDGVLSA
jgi:hypothetical protein